MGCKCLQKCSFRSPSSLLTRLHAYCTMHACNILMYVFVKRHTTNLNCSLSSRMSQCLTLLIALSLPNLIVCRKDTVMLLSKKIKLEVSEQDATALEFM